MNDIITQHEFIAIIKIIQIERKEIEQKKNAFTAQLSSTFNNYLTNKFRMKFFTLIELRHFMFSL